MRRFTQLAPLAAALLFAAACSKPDAAVQDSAVVPSGDSVAVVPSVSTDDDLDDRVEDALDADTALRAFDLDAEDDDTKVKLDGAVRTAEQKTHAEAVARGAGATTVENNIEVKADANMRTGDADDFEDRVEDALKADTALAGLDLDADDRRGALVLKGSARTAEQKAHAEAVAKRIAPTVTVTNEIRVP